MRQANSNCADQGKARPGNSSGQSIVELALMMPVMILILAGTLDLGRMYFSYMAVVNSAREGARFGATHPPALPCNTAANAQKIVARTRNEATASGVNTALMTVNVTCPEGGSDANKFGHPVKVEVSYDFHPILTRIIGFGAVRLRSDAQMQIYSQ